MSPQRPNGSRPRSGCFSPVRIGESHLYWQQTKVSKPFRSKLVQPLKSKNSGSKTLIAPALLLTIQARLEKNTKRNTLNLPRACPPRTMDQNGSSNCPSRFDVCFDLQDQSIWLLFSQVGIPAWKLSWLPSQCPEPQIAQ